MTEKMLNDSYTETPLKPDAKITVHSDIGQYKIDLWYAPIPKYKSTFSAKRKVDVSESTNLDKPIDEKEIAFNDFKATSRKIGMTILQYGVSHHE